MISKRRKSHKSRPFEHTEIPGLREVANWDDFPNPSLMETGIEQDTGSQLPEVASPQRELAQAFAIAREFSSLVSYSESSIKRGAPEPMDTKEMDMNSIPKKQKREQGQQLVLVKGSQEKGHVKKKDLVEEQQQKDPKTTRLQIQEYVFDGKIPRKHASKEDWLGSY